MSIRKREPVRTCAGCRKRDTRNQMVRFVLRSARACYDPKGVRVGRGAWVHRREECFAKAAKSGFARAFRARVDACDHLVMNTNDDRRKRVGS